MSIRAQLIGGLVAGALAFGAGWMVNGWRWDAKLSRKESAHAILLGQMAHATVASVEAARNEEARRTAAVEEQRDHAIEQNEALAAGVAAGRTASERLRAELQALRARYASGNTTIADGSQGQPDADAIGLLIELYSRLDSAGREVAEYADRLRIAGLTCERSYDAVRDRGLGE